MPDVDKLAEAQRVLLALVGRDPDTLGDTMFRYGRATARPVVREVVKLLRGAAKSAAKYNSLACRYGTFTERGKQLALVVLVVVEPRWETLLDRTAQRRHWFTVGAAVAPKVGEVTPGRAWPDELRPWRDLGYRHRRRVEYWAYRADERDDRVQFEREHLEPLISALEASVREGA